MLCAGPGGAASFKQYKPLPPSPCSVFSPRCLGVQSSIPTLGRAQCLGGEGAEPPAGLAWVCHLPQQPPSQALGAAVCGEHEVHLHLILTESCMGTIQLQKLPLKLEPHDFMREVGKNCFTPLKINEDFAFHVNAGFDQRVPSL